MYFNNLQSKYSQLIDVRVLENIGWVDLEYVLITETMQSCV